MNGTDRSAIVVTTPAATSGRTNGATRRADEVTALLSMAGYRVHTVRSTSPPIPGPPVDLAVGVSYACAHRLRELRPRARRVWLDVVDSWLLVNTSGLRRGHPGYLARAARDGVRLAALRRVDLATYISRADLDFDRRTVRAQHRLVLPGSVTATAVAGPTVTPRRLVLAGDWTYPPNADAWVWFRKAVLPLLESRLVGADWSVVVYGDHVPDADGGRLRMLGYSGDERELYRSNDVHLAPVRYGGGVKRKVLQPLLAGLPVVTTTVGAHGLQAHPLLHVQDGDAGFADAIVRLLLGQSTDPAPPDPRKVLDQDDTEAILAWLES